MKHICRECKKPFFDDPQHHICPECEETLYGLSDPRPQSEWKEEVSNDEKAIPPE